MGRFGLLFVCVYKEDFRMTISIQSQLDLVVITLFIISAAMIFYTFLRFIILKKHGQVFVFSIYLGLFALSFAVGEIFEFAEKIVDIKILGFLEKLVTAIGAGILLVALLNHTLGLVKIRRLPEEEIKYATTKKGHSSK